MRSLRFISLLFLSFILSGCYEGYLSSPEANVLLTYLNPESLKALTENPVENIIIIDVRPASNYADGHIPTALSFPSSEVMDRYQEIPLDKLVIVYCETGGRAQAVIRMLESKGYKLLMNWGGYTRWKWELVKD